MKRNCPEAFAVRLRSSAGAKRDETEAMMLAQGYRRRSRNDYESELLTVEDLHSGNVSVNDADDLLLRSGDLPALNRGRSPRQIQPPNHHIF